MPWCDIRVLASIAGLSVRDDSLEAADKVERLRCRTIRFAIGTDVESAVVRIQTQQTDNVLSGSISCFLLDDGLAS